MMGKKQRMFQGSATFIALNARLYERRSICVLPPSIASQRDPRGMAARCCGGTHTHFTRAKVVEAVARGEMRWCDRHHNTATFTREAACTWQKTRSGVGSGAVATMQLIEGEKGRYVPVQQRELQSEIA